MEIVPLTPASALLTSRETNDMQLKDGGAPRCAHTFTMLWKLDKDGWKIVHAHESWRDEPAAK